ncbi:IS3 family transposase [Candidatus Poribacteria bacterium]|nr:IS3 family transposase [Candidatus Poribacteria bacterium]MYH80173.1 IS3 family transposase [Candidatus Poribacteria bacterium]MYK94936.1 IS3 family transposase [Candidatus Poribacteria bacterium]
MLQRQGYTVGTRRVARLMREHHLLVAVKRASSRTTQSLQGEKPWSNRLENLEVSREDQGWVVDMTYVRLKGRFIYLAVLMDVFTRVIKAWQLGSHLSQSLTLKPLKDAFCRSVCEVHHSDQGAQYLSNAYVATLKAYGVEISLARRGRPWENGYAERLIRTLKEEAIHLNDYQDIHEAREDIGYFITQVYHQKRPHSALGYSTSKEFQRKTLS